MNEYYMYIPNLMLSYEAAYGTIYDNLEDILKAAYIPKIEQFANDEGSALKSGAKSVRTSPSVRPLLSGSPAKPKTT